MNPIKRLGSLLSPDPNPLAVREFASLCQRIALAYLRKAAASSSISADRLGLPLPDLAFDCIADLFRRDDSGRFPVLQRYFEEAGYGSMSDEELLGATRRLVFSQVTHSLYRQHGEEDPDLRRIIRNIKDAAAPLRFVRIEQLRGVTTLVLGRAPHHLPQMAREILECHLTEKLTHSMTVREILLTAVEIFAEQETYRRSFPLTGFALLVRAAFANLEKSESDNGDQSVLLAEGELRGFVMESISHVSQKMHEGYVGKRKLTEDLYSSYFNAIGEILCSEYVSNDGVAESYFDHLSEQLQGLTQKEYQSDHRTIVEYLAKLTRKEFLQRVREELRP